MEVNSYLLQYERLRRHFEIAVHTYDPVSLLDLAHTLRVWADTKSLIRSEAPEFARSIRFKACHPSRRATILLKSREHVYSLFADGVVTYASQGQDIVGILESTRNRNDAEVSVKFREVDKGLMVSSYAYWTGKIETSRDDLFGDQGTKHCTYEQWLDSRVVLGAMPAGHGVMPFSLSLENLIRRVANEFNASHPAGLDVPAPAKQASQVTHYLFGHVVAGLPLPYFLLLKAAHDILLVGAKFFGQSTTT